MRFRYGTESCRSAGYGALLDSVGKAIRRAEARQLGARSCRPRDEWFNRCPFSFTWSKRNEFKARRAKTALGSGTTRARTAEARSRKALARVHGRGCTRCRSDCCVRRNQASWRLGPRLVSRTRSLARRHDPSISRRPKAKDRSEAPPPHLFRPLTFGLQSRLNSAPALPARRSCDSAQWSDHAGRAPC